MSGLACDNQLLKAVLDTFNLVTFDNFHLNFISRNCPTVSNIQLS